MESLNWQKAIEARHTSLSETWERKLAAYRQRSAEQSEKRERRNEQRRKLARRLADERANGMRADWTKIAAAVCKAALDLQRGNGKTIEMMRRGGSCWEMVAQDYRLDVMRTLRLVARRFPHLAARPDRKRWTMFRQHLGRAFERAGLYPVYNYFADVHPAAKLDADYRPPMDSGAERRKRRDREAGVRRRHRWQLMDDVSH